MRDKAEGNCATVAAQSEFARNRRRVSDSERETLGRGFGIIAIVFVRALRPARFRGHGHFL